MLVIGMSDHRSMFLVFCLLIMKVTAQEAAIFEVLDLAEEAFDDQYQGCRQAMERKLEAQQVLKAEREVNRHFRRAWDEAERRWHSDIKEGVRSSLPVGFHDLHGVALVTYSGFIREYFTSAGRSAGRSYRNYMEDFHYKALHYYLTVALQLLSGPCRDPTHLLYRGLENLSYRVPQGVTRVKFGQFFQAFEDQLEQIEVGNGSLLVLQSCSAVPIERFSEFPKEQEYIISGSEVFTASEDENDGGTLYLESTRRLCANFNCAYITGEASKQSLDHCINAAATSGTTFFSIIVTLLVGLFAAAEAHL